MLCEKIVNKIHIFLDFGTRCPSIFSITLQNFGIFWKKISPNLQKKRSRKTRPKY